VWQLWVQWPSQFEFGPSLLMFLLDSLYTCRFGSFLADSHQDRTRGTSALPGARISRWLLTGTSGGLGDTVSVWAYIFAHKSDFLNSAYDAKARVTKLAVHPAQVTLWTGSSPAHAQPTLSAFHLSSTRRVLSAMGGGGERNP
jgi:hypothetical protein